MQILCLLAKTYKNRLKIVNFCPIVHVRTCFFNEPLVKSRFRGYLLDEIFVKGTTDRALLRNRIGSGCFEKHDSESSTESMWLFRRTKYYFFNTGLEIPTPETTSGWAAAPLPNVKAIGPGIPDTFSSSKKGKEAMFRIRVILRHIWILAHLKIIVYKKPVVFHY
jgi:hypothetical protein